MANVIFDFDGTIADSIKAFVEILGSLINRPIPDDTEIDRLRSLPLLSIMRELKIPLWKVPRLIKKARKLYPKHIEEIQPHQGMPQVVRELHSAGHRLWIMSTNSPVSIKHFLSTNGIDKYFIQIYGNVGVFSKSRALRKVLRQNKLNPEDSYYIGDEGRDIEASYDNGVKSIAVTWGFAGTKLLRELKPYGTTPARTPIQYANQFADCLPRL